jgi:hypothetical protein
MTEEKGRDESLQKESRLDQEDELSSSGASPESVDSDGPPGGGSGDRRKAQAFRHVFDHQALEGRAGDRRLFVSAPAVIDVAPGIHGKRGA